MKVLNKKVGKPSKSKVLCKAETVRVVALGKEKLQVKLSFIKPAVVNGNCSRQTKIINARHS